MTTLQEWLNNKYPTREEKERVEKIIVEDINKERKNQGITEKLEGGELDLSEFVNVKVVLVVNGETTLKSKLTKLTLGKLLRLKTLNCYDNQLTSLDVSGCSALTRLNCEHNQLTSVKFLNQLPHPEKLNSLYIYNNNIQTTDIALFSKFVNLEVLKIGTEEDEGKHNKFYGSFQSWQNLTKLNDVCIEATDVNEGLEYLPFSLAKATKGGRYSYIECSPHDTNAKCSQIQDQLKPFNYDLEAWQLAHPELMLKSKPEYFTQEESKEQWLNALATKIEKTQQELQATKTNLPDKVKKIQRLTSKLASLEHIKNLLEQIEQERDIHQEAMKNLDNWYHQLPLHDNNLKNILDQFANDYLALNRDKQTLSQENQQLKQNLAISNKILEQEYQSKETKDQGTQTETNDETLEQKQKEIQELKQKISQLENSLDQQQTKFRTVNPPKNN